MEGMKCAPSCLESALYGGKHQEQNSSNIFCRDLGIFDKFDNEGLRNSITMGTLHFYIYKQ